MVAAEMDEAEVAMVVAVVLVWGGAMEVQAVWEVGSAVAMVVAAREAANAAPLHSCRCPVGTVCIAPGPSALSGFQEGTESGRVRHIHNRQGKCDSRAALCMPGQGAARNTAPTSMEMESAQQAPQQYRCFLNRIPCMQMRRTRPDSTQLSKALVRWRRPNKRSHAGMHCRK